PARQQQAERERGGERAGHHVTFTSAVPSNFPPCVSKNVTVSGPLSVARNGIVNVGFSLTEVEGSISTMSRPRYVTTARLPTRYVRWPPRPPCRSARSWGCSTSARTRATAPRRTLPGIASFTRPTSAIGSGRAPRHRDAHLARRGQQAAVGRVK